MRDDIPDIIRAVGFDFSWENEKVWKLDVPVTEIDISELTWHFDIPFHWHAGGIYNLKSRDILENPALYPEEYTRTMDADLGHPIDLMENKGKWLILDGLHRLMKAQVLGMKTVNVRIIPRGRIPEIVK